MSDITNIPTASGDAGLPGLSDDASPAEISSPWRLLLAPGSNPCTTGAGTQRVRQSGSS